MMNRHEAETVQFLALADKHPHLATCLALARSRFGLGLLSIIGTIFVVWLGAPQHVIALVANAWR